MTTALLPQMLEEHAFTLIARDQAVLQGLTGTVSRLHMEADHVKWLLAQEKSQSWSRERGFSIGFNFWRMQPVFGVDGSSGQSNCLTFIPNTLKLTEALALIGRKDVTIEVQASAPTGKISTPLLIYDVRQNQHRSTQKHFALEWGTPILTVAGGRFRNRDDRAAQRAGLDVANWELYDVGQVVTHAA